jgi:hypothetical protein
VVAHFGINYVAQLLMSFFTLVACIAVLTFEAKQSMARITIEVDYTEMAEPALAS